MPSDREDLDRGALGGGYQPFVEGGKLPGLAGACKMQGVSEIHAGHGPLQRLGNGKRLFHVNAREPCQPSQRGEHAFPGKVV